MKLTNIPERCIDCGATAPTWDEIGHRDNCASLRKSYNVLTGFQFIDGDYGHWTLVEKNSQSSRSYRLLELLPPLARELWESGQEPVGDWKITIEFTPRSDTHK